MYAETREMDSVESFQFFQIILENSSTRLVWYIQDLPSLFVALLPSTSLIGSITA